MAAIRRVKPPALQIADIYEDRIRTGQIRPGEQLPTVQLIAIEQGVSASTAWRAMKHLRAAQLVTIDPRVGTFAGPRRLVSGPQDVGPELSIPQAQVIVVNAHEHVPAPEYVADILLMGPDDEQVPDGGPRPGGAHWVIRREQVHYVRDDDEQVPFMLSVEWLPGDLAGKFPELLSDRPLPAPGGAVALAAEGRRPVAGTIADEARPIRDDGREGRWLNVPRGYVVMAKTVKWVTPDRVLGYSEWVMRQGLVTVIEYPA